MTINTDIITIERIDFICGGMRVESVFVECDLFPMRYAVRGISRGVEFHQFFDDRNDAKNYMDKQTKEIKEEILDILQDV